jgi:hypothetical protein
MQSQARHPAGSHRSTTQALKDDGIDTNDSSESLHLFRKGRIAAVLLLFVTINKILAIVIDDCCYDRRVSTLLAGTESRQFVARNISRTAAPAT